jgi:predicted transposase YdaD
MGNYNLRDTWIYQEIRQEVQLEERQQCLLEQRQLLLEIIEVRFPRLLAQAQACVEIITERALLHTLIVRVSHARLTKEARQALTEANKGNKVKT